jgi:branched-chain amino acid transport system permease protein
MALFVNQLLNGVQLGLTLFLLAAGLSLVFGIMNFVNLAHGVFYMIGAYLAATFSFALDSFILGIVLAIPATFALAMILEATVARRLYRADHLEQVLATYGLVLCFDTAVKYIWGPEGISVALPTWLDGQIGLAGVALPVYRLFIVVASLLVAGLLWLVVTRTRAGMMVRAAASNEEMARALGIETRLVFAMVFAVGAVMAGLAGMLVAPVTGATIGMGNQTVILALVVIIIGGIGSIGGAFIAAMGVGLIDTLGRAYLPEAISGIFSSDAASAAGPAFTSILIYLIMAIVLVFRPAGLFPPASR